MSDVIAVRVQRVCSECGGTFYETLIDRDDEVINTIVTEEGDGECPHCIKKWTALSRPFNMGEQGYWSGFCVNEPRPEGTWDGGSPLWLLYPTYPMWADPSKAGVPAQE